MTRRMQMSEMDSYTILSHSFFGKDHLAAEEMTVWCEDNIGPMDGDWAVTLRPIKPGERWETIWVFRNPNDALAMTMRFRGS